VPPISPHHEFKRGDQHQTKTGTEEDGTQVRHTKPVEYIQATRSAGRQINADQHARIKPIPPESNHGANSLHGKVIMTQRLLERQGRDVFTAYAL
jgi:hypothetical protein